MGQRFDSINDTEIFQLVPNINGGNDQKYVTEQIWSSNSARGHATSPRIT